MTKDIVLKRKAELEQQRQQLVANVNAILGALQDCEFWLAQFEAKPEIAAVEPEAALQ